MHLIAQNRYGSYCIPQNSAHRIAAQTVLAGNVWEPETVEFIRTHAGTGDVVHAGTYFGDMLPGISAALAPEAKLWAFEPNPENFAAAAGTVQRNSLSNVELTNKGLGSAPTSARMIVRENGRSLGGVSAIIEAYGRVVSALTEDTITIPLTTIDAAVNNRPVSIIHLDVEGFEEFALDGAIQTIKRCRPILILETVPLGWVERNNYSVQKKLDASYVATNYLLIPSST